MFDTTNISINEISAACFEVGQDYYFAGGLGLINLLQWAPFFDTESKLVYYSKGLVKWGTPYYILDGSQRVKYMPLPEDCATWTNTLSCYNQSCANATEQIQTNGTKYVKGDKILVELVYRAFYNGILSPDSVIGFFYNDTLNQKAIFCADTSCRFPVVIYDATLRESNGCGCAEGHFTIDTTLIDGNYRTRWNCNEAGPCSFANPYNLNSMIAGVGQLSGLIRVNYKNTFPYSTLSCFSVCGETLYPTHGANVCPLLTGVFEVDGISTSFSLTPNPANSAILITADKSLMGGTLTITDMAGRVVRAAKMDSEKLVMATDFASGLYFVTLSNGQQSTTRKLVVGK